MPECSVLIHIVALGPLPHVSEWSNIPTLLRQITHRTCGDNVEIEHGLLWHWVLYLQCSVLIVAHRYIACFFLQWRWFQIDVLDFRWLLATSCFFDFLVILYVSLDTAAMVNAPGLMWFPLKSFSWGVASRRKWPRSVQIAFDFGMSRMHSKSRRLAGLETWREAKWHKWHMIPCHHLIHIDIVSSESTKCYLDTQRWYPCICHNFGYGQGKRGLASP